MNPWFFSKLEKLHTLLERTRWQPSLSHWKLAFSLWCVFKWVFKLRCCAYFLPHSSCGHTNIWRVSECVCRCSRRCARDLKSRSQWVQVYTARDISKNIPTNRLALTNTGTWCRFFEKHNTYFACVLERHVYVEVTIFQTPMNSLVLCICTLNVACDVGEGGSSERTSSYSLETHI